MRIFNFVYKFLLPNISSKYRKKCQSRVKWYCGHSQVPKENSTVIQNYWILNDADVDCPTKYLMK
jgi:hypothetical protein